MAIYNFTGVIENEAIVIDLVPDSAFLKQTITQEILVNNQPVKITVPKVGYGNVHLNAKLVNKGSLEGIWKST